MKYKLENYIVQLEKGTQDDLNAAFNYLCKDYPWILHCFAVDCAERTFKLAMEKGIHTDIRSWNAIVGKKNWLLGEVSDKDLETLQSASFFPSNGTEEDGTPIHACLYTARAATWASVKSSMSAASRTARSARLAVMYHSKSPEHSKAKETKWQCKHLAWWIKFAVTYGYENILDGFSYEKKPSLLHDHFQFSLLRWILLPEVSHSKKSLYLCSCCGRKSTSPDKRCPPAICYDGATRDLNCYIWPYAHGHDLARSYITRLLKEI